MAASRSSGGREITLARTRYFGPELFGFLRELRRNNRREWFLAHKERYETHARQPMLRFIADFGPVLRKISPHLVADPRPVGGSMFRIHRDTRFSKDKSPYKTVVSAQFRHEAAGDVHAPGLYLHLEPGEVFSGAGIWHPDAVALQKVRDGIVAAPPKWRRAISSPTFRKACTFSGEKLQRPPKGYDPEHPCIEDLKWKDYVVVMSFTESEACSPGFMDRFASACRASAPFLGFLTRAIGLPW